MGASDLPVMRQALAVPYREVGGEFSFCLITSLAKGKWGFPKGIVDPGETAEQTAAKESWEEAGLRGDVVSESLGEYEDFKWGYRLIVAGYMLRVTEVADQWLESDRRERAFLPPAKARSQLARNEQRGLLDAALRQLGME